MRLYIFFSIFLILNSNCTVDENEEKCFNNQNSITKKYENVDFKKDTTALKFFFKDWQKYSEQLSEKNIINSKIEQDLYEIFHIVYHPKCSVSIKENRFSSRFHEYSYKYFVLPSFIDYAVVSELKVKNEYYAIGRPGLKRINDFFPKMNEFKGEYLFWTSPFKNFIEKMFTDELRYDLIDFFPVRASSFELETFVLTDPRIHFILFNKNRSKSIVSLSIIINPYYCYLEKKNGNWNITKIESVLDNY